MNLAPTPLDPRDKSTEINDDTARMDETAEEIPAGNDHGPGGHTASHLLRSRAVPRSSGF